MTGDQRPPIDVPLPPGYTVVEKLGAGGFATVWLAEQGQLGRRVAVKLLGETLEDDERERRFLAECRAVGRLSGHPAVVTVHDAGTTADGRPYLVMEHLPGGSLHDRLRTSGPLTWAEVADVGVHVADALSAAHDTGILHRDVKPANVLVDETGAPKLADFGIARLAEGTATATGHVLGTILYTPPEVLSGRRPAPTADVWALGAMLHTLLTGRSPFAGDEDEPPAASIARVLRSEAPDLPATLPRDLTDLIGSMLAADPEDRPQSAAEVARRLQRIQVAHGLPVTPARSTRDVVDAVGAGSDATQVGFAPISADLTDRADPPSVPDPPAPSSPTVVVPPPRQATGPTPTPPPAGGDAPAVTADVRTTPVAPAAPPPEAATPPPGPASGPAATAVVGSTVAVGPEASGPPAGGWPGGPGEVGRSPAPPPGAPPSRGRRGLLLVAVLVVGVLVAAAVGAVVLLGGGDDDGGGEAAGGSDPGASTEASGGDEATAAQVETIWGVTTPVPSGTSTAPSALDGGPGAVDCAGDFSCGATTVDGQAVVAYPVEDGSLNVDRLNADGSSEWSTPVDTPAVNVSVVLAGAVILVATVEDDPASDDPAEQVRAYRGLDSSSGVELWGPTTFDDDIRTLRPTDQASADVSLLLATGDDGPEVIAMDNATGEQRWTNPGRMLAADVERVYQAGPGIVARDIATGEEVWSSDVQVIGDGASPVGQLGVAIDGLLVTVSGDDVVAFEATGGSEAWPPQPLSDGDAQLDVPLALSAAGGRAVVVAQAGDLGIDAASGTVEWRLSRAPLLAQDQDNVWIGTEDRLVVGQLGGQLRLIATDQAGEELTSVATGALEPSRSSFAFAGGVALLSNEGITAYSTDDLSELWSDTSVAGARTLVTTDGGVVLLGPSGVTVLQG